MQLNHNNHIAHISSIVSYVPIVVKKYKVEYLGFALTLLQTDEPHEPIPKPIEAKFDIQM